MDYGFPDGFVIDVPQPVTDPYKFEEQLNVFERGRILKNEVSQQAWDIIHDTIRSYVDDIDKQLRELPPGDSGVVAAHAGLSVMDQFQHFFKEATKEAMEFASKPPQDFLTNVARFRDVNDVARQMEKSETVR